MTQTVLTNGEKTARSVKSPVLTYGKNLLKQNKKFIILLSAMHLLGAPFVMLFAILDQMSKPENGSVDYEFTVVIAVLCLIIAFLSGVPIAMNCFRHLHDKQTVDMEISLPLNMKERFFTGYLSGLAAYLLPFIAAEIITLIELPIFRSALLNKMKDSDSLSPDETLIIYPIFGELVLGGLLLMASFYTFFVLTSCFCGQKNEAAGYGIAANFCIPTLFLCVYLIIAKYGFGYNVSIDNDSVFSILFGMTSPLGEGISLAVAISALIDPPGADIKISFFSLLNFGGWVVKTLLFTLVCLFSAYFVYRKRRSEQTGKSFAFYGFYHFIMTTLCIVIIVFFSSISMDGALITSGIISAIIYVILDSVSNRGIKKLGKSFIKFGITFAGSLLIILLVRYTGFFGVMYRVPDVSEISSAEVSFNEPITRVRHDLTLTGEEALEKVIGFQKDSIDAYKKLGMKYEVNDHYYDESTIGMFEIEYTLKNGTVEERSYPIYPDTVHYINELMLTEEVKQYKISLFSETVKSNFRVETNGEEYIVPVGANGCDANKLISCYTRDMQNLTKERYYGGYRAFEEYGCFITDTSWNNIRINSFFPETAKYLSEFVPLENMYSEYFDKNDRVRILKAHGNGEVPVDYLSSLDSLSPLENICVIYSGDEDDRYGAEFEGSPREISYFSLSEEQHEKLLEIISCSYTAYIPSGECYIISTGGLRGYIPEEYYEFIEKNFV